MVCRCAVVLAVVLLAGGCGERSDPIAPPATEAGEIESVARAIALGMARPAARLAVRDAMRASPLTEHKLSLQGFANGRAGEALLQAAALATGTTVGAQRARIASLPNLDFYVPARGQRLTWQGGSDYLVAVRLGDGSWTGYNARGKKIALDPRGGLPRETVFFVQAAETKSDRIARQEPIAGQTIEDPGDGELSGTIELRDRTGIPLTIGLADWTQVQRPIGRMMCLECGGSGGGSEPPPQTYLQEIITYDVWDNGNPWETNEFEFRARTPGGLTEAIRIEGVPSSGEYPLHIHLIYALPPMWVGGEDGAIAARETDGWPNPDDTWVFFYNNPPPETGTSCKSIPLGSNVDNQQDMWRYFVLNPTKCSNAPNLKVNFTW